MKNLIRENESYSEFDFTLLDDKRFNLKSVNNNNKTFSENSLKNYMKNYIKNVNTEINY
jgi:hypothetical protein